MNEHEYEMCRSGRHIWDDHHPGYPSHPEYICRICGLVFSDYESAKAADERLLQRRLRNSKKRAAEVEAKLDAEFRELITS